jgi:hypothetical protein
MLLLLRGWAAQKGGCDEKVVWVVEKAVGTAGPGKFSFKGFGR